MTSNPERVPRPFSDSSVVITGGTSGIGLATAVQFAEAGVSRIALIGRNEERGRKAREVVLAARPGITVEFISGDMNEPGQVVEACEAARSRLGAIDILVNSTVGPFGPALCHNIPIEDFLPIVVKQLMAPLYASRAVLPWMRERREGVIINISSDAGKLATPGETVIGAAMAGIIMFSRALALEAKRDGVRVNAVTPSVVKGTMTNASVMSDPFSAKLFEGAMRAAHLGVCVPDDLAALIVFLASPEASRITGQAISVTGGISAV